MIQKIIGFSALLIVLAAVPVAFTAAQNSDPSGTCCEECVLSGCDDCSDGNCICEPFCCVPEEPCDCCVNCGCSDCVCDAEGCDGCGKGFCVSDVDCGAECCAASADE